MGFVCRFLDFLDSVFNSHHNFVDAILTIRTHAVFNFVSGEQCATAFVRTFYSPKVGLKGLEPLTNELCLLLQLSLPLSGL